MNNILYIGPYREFSGMGNAARQYIKALIRTGNNISLRPIYNVFKPYPEQSIDNEILELESNSSKSYHSVIQHCYPHQLTLDKRFEKNIGIIHLESFNYGEGLSDYFKLMDHIIVGSNFVYKTLIYSGVDPNKIKIIPEPIDLNIIDYYKQENNKTRQDTNYSFYTIVDLIDRKNLEKIILAYGLAYDQDDNVDLVIKIKNFSNTDLHLDQTIEYILAKTYATLKKNYAKKPKIILGNIKYDGILYVHNNNDCFINISSGESFGYSTLEAMAFNNNIIVNDKIGSSEILAERCGLINKVKEINCIDSNRLYYQYNTIDNLWYEPDINNLITNMYKAYNETESERIIRVSNQNSRLQYFTTDNIAKELTFL